MVRPEKWIGNPGHVIRKNTITACDLFCGAGGTSQGFLNACQSLEATPDLLAVNHWPRAVATHLLNHPSVRHLCENLDGVNPRLAVPGGRLNLLCASPECTHHSRAAGGRPKNEQSRATAWHICRWAEALDVDNILIENVKEFLDWGPLGRDRKPLKRKKGKTFRAFIGAIESLGYRVEHRLLTAADFGDPTTRQRLFILAKKSGPIVWPKQSHGSELLPKWRSAREIIDWKTKGQSIFRRKKPLCQNTLRRIAAGLRKFGGATVEPFLVILNGTSDGHISSSSRKISDPVPTVTTSLHSALVEPFLIHITHSGSDRCHNIDSPVPTVTTAHRGEMSLIEPMIIGQQSCSAARTVGEPLPTVAGSGAIALVEPFLTRYQGKRKSGIEENRNYSLNVPLPTQDTSNRFALIEPFIVKYYGNGIAKDLSQPLDSVTTRDRFMLVCPKSGEFIAELDILFRMLQPGELAAAQGFPSHYQFTGTREEQVKQIGNAVPVNIATALCRALLNP